jgi:hypothetical protein
MADAHFDYEVSSVVLVPKKLKIRGKKCENCQAQEYFTYMEKSPLPVKGCKV